MSILDEPVAEETLDLTPPTDGATPPTDEATPPTDEATPPTDDATPPTGDVTPPPEAVLDENWRKTIAGDDEKWLKQLNRYQSPKAMAEALREAQTKISKGQAKSLPENPTDEEMATWREQNDIPATAAGYDLTLDDGLVIGDDDKEIVSSYLKAMHGANATQGQIKSGLNAFFAAREADIAAVEVKDDGDRTDALATLRDEWGPDFQSNKNALSALVNQIPEAAREPFMNARLGDGTAMMNSPEVLMFLADVSRKTNPAATVVPNSNNPSQAIADEKAEIESLMAANSPKYWKDEAMQARYRELLTAEEGMAK